MGRKKTPESAGPSELVVARREMPAFITGQGEPYRPHALMMVEPRSGLIVGVNAVHPSTTAEQAAAWVADTLVPDPGSRFRVRTADAGLADALRRALGGAHEVVLAGTPEAEAPLTSLALSLVREPDEGPVLEQASLPAVARFFEAGQRVFRLAPWRRASDGDALGVSAPGHGYPEACACIIGEARQSLGVVVFESLADYLHTLRLSDRPATHLAGPEVPTVSINFEPASRVRPAWRRLAKEQGWPVARGGFPQLMVIEPDALLRPLGDREYEFAAAVLEGVALFVEEHGDAFGRALAGELSSRLATAAGEVVLTAPPPGAPWKWGEEHAYEAVRRERRPRRR